MHTDIIIIGAGPGGYETAIHAARHGLSVTIIEERKAGGTCLNEGCIPTKALCKNAEAMELMKKSEEFGIEGLSYSINFQQVIERKNRVVDTLRMGVETLLKHKLITYVQGKAQFKDAHTVLVEEEAYSADYILIATGSVNKPLPIPGTNLPGVITSREILDIDHIPQRLCVVGGGVIGLEFASIFHRFGSQVTVVEYAKELLPNFDNDLSKRLKQSLSKSGIEIYTQAAVTEVTQLDGALGVSFTHKGKPNVCLTDNVLIAVGRAANVEALNLQEVGINFTPKGITTDENMCTNIPHIYAIGDVNGRCMLAHAASFQGLRALNHLRGEKDAIRFDLIPSAVFTVPEVATVGLTEEQCKEQGMAFTAKKSFYRANGKALAMGEPEGFCKILVSSDSGKVLGCHLMGAHAADIVQEVCALMNRDITLEEFRSIIHAHPTLNEVVQNALWN